MPVPVIVVGNISVGGTGKTPLTISLAGLLRNHRFYPGIICRGYRGNARTPQAVTADSDPRVVGDEAVLLARESGSPVWIGANRVDAARGLLAANARCNLIISDDGLQHYALGRDYEIAVIDAARGIGNGLLLPAGPLRETADRLRRVNAIVMNGDGAAPDCETAVYRMTLHGNRFFNLKNVRQNVDASHFSGCTVHAVAAIGNPSRFFAQLKALGIAFIAHPFPDHHAFTPDDIKFGDDEPVIMTAKDAVKCEHFASESHWVQRVDALIDGDLAGDILRRIGKSR